MAVIKKIKIPGETLPRDIGVNSSNVVYDGDSGTTTTLNSKIQSIFTAIGDINSFEIALVNALPTENIDDHTIYFVPNAQDANTRDEYMYVGNQWEMIGSTTIDLSDYPTYDDITVTQGLTTGIPAATITVGDTSTIVYSNPKKIWYGTCNSSATTSPKIVSGISSSDFLWEKGSIVCVKFTYTNSTNPFKLMIGGTSKDVYLNGRTTSINGCFWSANSIVTFLYDGTRFEIISKSSYDLDYSRTGHTHNYSKVQLNQNLTSGEEIASITIDSVTTTLYAPTPTMITATQALTTGITIGSIDVSGTTTTFYAPEVPQKYEVILDYDENNDKFSFHNSEDRVSSIIKKIKDGYDVKAIFDDDGANIIFIPNMIDYDNENYISFIALVGDSKIVLDCFGNYPPDEDVINGIQDPISPIMDVSYTSAITPNTGITIGYLYINGESTPLYTNKDQYVTQTYITNPITVDSGYKHVLLSSDYNHTTSDTTSKKIDTISFNPQGELKISGYDTNANQSVEYCYNGLNITNDNVTSEIRINRSIDSGHHVIEIPAYTTTAVRLASIVNGATIGGITVPVYANDQGQLIPCSLPIPSITATAGLTTGVTIGAIDINGVTTTFYAPEDTKVTQTDVTGSTENVKYPVLLSAQTITAGTITDDAVKSDNFMFNPKTNVFIVSGDGQTAYNGGFYLNDYVTRRNQVTMTVRTPGTSTTPGNSMLQLGNQYSTADGDGNSKGLLVLLGEGERGNQLHALDNGTGNIPGLNKAQYINYLPMVDNAVLAGGSTTGVGSSTVPVYMTAGGELLACTLPTSASYSLSMTGATITLLADGVAASTITLPIYDGTIQ